MTTLNGRYPAIEGEGEFEFEYEAEAEAEDELEGELEDEAEAFANPVRRIYRDAELMAHLSTRAAQAEAESEAEAFLGALVPLAARLIPRAAAVISRNAPALIAGTNRIGRRLRHNPATRSLVTAMPVILQQTAQVLADRAPDGSLTASDVIGTLADVAGDVLAPHRRRRAVRAVGVFDRRYRRRARLQRQPAMPRYSGVGAGGARPSATRTARRARRRY